MSVWKEVEVHKSLIQSGDTILHNGKMMTVCKRDITRCSFMGICIFGDSYKSGYQLVKKMIYNLKNKEGVK